MTSTTAGGGGGASSSTRRKGLALCAVDEDVFTQQHIEEALTGDARAVSEKLAFSEQYLRRQAPSLLLYASLWALPKGTQLRKAAEWAERTGGCFVYFGDVAGDGNDLREVFGVSWESVPPAGGGFVRAPAVLSEHMISNPESSSCCLPQSLNTKSVWLRNVPPGQQIFVMKQRIATTKTKNSATPSTAAASVARKQSPLCMMAAAPVGSAGGKLIFCGDVELGRPSVAAAGRLSFFFSTSSSSPSSSVAKSSSNSKGNSDGTSLGLTEKNSQTTGASSSASSVAGGGGAGTVLTTAEATAVSAARTTGATGAQKRKEQKQPSSSSSSQQPPHQRGKTKNESELSSLPQPSLAVTRDVRGGEKKSSNGDADMSRGKAQEAALLVGTLKDEAAEQFSRGRFSDAVTALSNAINLQQQHMCNVPSEEPPQQPQPAVLHTNRALVYQKLGKFDRAYADALKSLEIDPSWTKGHLVAGYSLFLGGKRSEYSSAVEHFEKAQEKFPQCVEALQECRDSLKRAEEEKVAKIQRQEELKAKEEERQEQLDVARWKGKYIYHSTFDELKAAAAEDEADPDETRVELGLAEAHCGYSRLKRAIQTLIVEKHDLRVKYWFQLLKIIDRVRTETTIDGCHEIYERIYALFGDCGNFLLLYDVIVRKLVPSGSAVQTTLQNIIAGIFNEKAMKKAKRGDNHGSNPFCPCCVAKGAMVRKPHDLSLAPSMQELETRTASFKLPWYSYVHRPFVYQLFACAFLVFRDATFRQTGLLIGTYDGDPLAAVLRDAGLDDDEDCDQPVMNISITTAFRWFLRMAKVQVNKEVGGSRVVIPEWWDNRRCFMAAADRLRTKKRYFYSYSLSAGKMNGRSREWGTLAILIPFAIIGSTFPFHRLAWEEPPFRVPATMTREIITRNKHLRPAVDLHATDEPTEPRDLLDELFFSSSPRLFSSDSDSDSDDETSTADEEDDVDEEFDEEDDEEGDDDDDDDDDDEQEEEEEEQEEQEQDVEEVEDEEIAAKQLSAVEDALEKKHQHHQQKQNTDLKEKKDEQQLATKEKLKQTKVLLNEMQEKMHTFDALRSRRTEEENMNDHALVAPVIQRLTQQKANLEKMIQELEKQLQDNERMSIDINLVD